jgi:hypothetical protein
MMKGPEHDYFLNQAAIEINGKANYIYLLHGGAWTSPGDVGGTIRFEYADNTNAEKQVIVGKDLDDWWNPKELVNAKVAWIGSNPVHIPVGLYVSEFANPVPDKSIKKIIFQSGKTVWGIVGVTLSSKQLPLTGQMSMELLKKKLEKFLSAAEITKRIKYLQARIRNPVSLESDLIKLTVSSEKGAYQIEDKSTGVKWYSNPYQERFGIAEIDSKSGKRQIILDNFNVRSKADRIELVYQPKKGEDINLTVVLELLKDGRTIEISYKTEGKTKVDNIALLDNSLWVTDVDNGYAVVPVRMGLIVPADTGLSFTRSFPTYNYEGCHMEMLGAVRKGSAVLVTWHDPYVTAELNSETDRSVLNNLPAHQLLATSLYLSKSAYAVRVQLLGSGDYAAIAGAYRKTAMEKGYLVTWDEKLKKNPGVEKLFGAINFKLWSTLSRRIDDKTREETTSLNWTFEEAGKVAEHLKNDLKLDRVLFTLGGWIKRGYDNQHPDILPAAPECGGNEGLAACSKIVRNLGYVFCLHDNYQDIYSDSPSWDEDLITKNEDGSLVKGGMWAGGQAWIICSEKGLELAKRKQNLPDVRKLFSPDAFFPDTTYAADLYECYDPKHPMTKWDDIKYKIGLSDYTRALFGIFGSECGREWAIPHSDFFEGLTGVSGRYYHFDNCEFLARIGAVVPIFEMVYRKCIAMYGKYGYDYSKAAEYVLHHVSIGRTLNYHRIGRHLYWQRGKKPDPKIPVSDAACFTRADNGWAQDCCLDDRFLKNTYEILSPLNELTSRMEMTGYYFLTPDRKVHRTTFGQEVEVIVNKSDSKYTYRGKNGKKIVLPPYGFIINSPAFIAFHSLTWEGLKYKKPVLFTIRSLDKQPISKSSKLRIFHGFGDSRLRLREKTYDIQRETLIKK